MKEQKISEEYLSKIEIAKNNANEIIFALQFQDIISQKLEHTSRILSAVYENFMELFDSFVKMKERTSLGKDIINAIENECNVAMRQEKTDKFNKQTEDKIRNQGISQADIDKLFN